MSDRKWNCRMWTQSSHLISRIVTASVTMDLMELRLVD
jgi:hypothetical protein